MSPFRTQNCGPIDDHVIGRGCPAADGELDVTSTERPLPMTPPAPEQGDHLGRSPDFAGRCLAEPSQPIWGQWLILSRARRLQLRGQSRICTAFPFTRAMVAPGPKQIRGYAGKDVRSSPNATGRMRVCVAAAYAIRPRRRGPKRAAKARITPETVAIMPAALTESLAPNQIGPYPART